MGYEQPCFIVARSILNKIDIILGHSVFILVLTVNEADNPFIFLLFCPEKRDGLPDRYAGLAQNLRLFYEAVLGFGFDNEPLHDITDIITIRGFHFGIMESD